MSIEQMVRLDEFLFDSIFKSAALSELLELA